MLLDAKLTHKFWAEAVSTATYLRNKSPTSALKKTTPHEAWYGQKPRVDHLRVFGSSAYTHIPKDERGKLDSKTKKCILLGYGSVQKGYRVFDPITQKISHSRNVKFDERESEMMQLEEEESTQHPLILDTIEGTESVVEEETITPEEHSRDEPQQPDREPRRSTRERRPVDYYGFPPQAHLVIHDEPTTHREATSSQDSAKWSEAMGRELDSLKNNNVWDLTTLPAGKKAIGSKCVYKVKTNSDGSIERYKARLVAKGFNQKFGSDYDETFCPVVRLESLRNLIALSAKHKLQLHHVDVHTAFLNGTLQEEVYMEQPVGYVRKGEEHLVCRLKKSIYGLKQASRCWNSVLDSHLRAIGFTQSKSDPCIYMSGKDDKFFIAVYVDDMILAGSKEDEMKKVKEQLLLKFDIKDLGKLRYFLGMSVIQNDEKATTWMGQPTYIEKLLTKMGMNNCNPVKTPMNSGDHLVKANENAESRDQQGYQSLIGSLLYLATCTRPDIAFAVGVLARFCSKPDQSHWTAAKRVLRYLKGTSNYGIIFRGDVSSVPIGYSDADWAGDIEGRKSTSGYVFCIAGGPVSWRSKKQDTVALSTAEVEYVALSSAAQECIWIKRLNSEFGNMSDGPAVIMEDNQSCIAIAKNPQHHGRSKHIDIKHHFIRELVGNKTIELRYCPIKEMAADFLTKALVREQFCYLQEKAGITEP